MNRLPWRRRLAYIGLGSNLDSPEAQVERAIRRLDSIPRSNVVARSSLYRSAAFGPVEQPDFINAVAALSTRLSSGRLLAELKRLEEAMGRRPAVRWGPRRIDLDLLLYGEDVVDRPGLKVPHPGIAERNFVLLPLREIAPELVVPGLGRLADIEVNENEPGISRVDS
ncbi:MAG: 2-amino-4-hydroxy-6-hydroxymethyldihydropteridine diphosphokinase [Woeseiaceae bacterium]|nr:2-amino-4-hydroxy-6-hydroxymethyldihydropteridine diphosphokinase [Woeseiaceae bacterium]